MVKQLSESSKKCSLCELLKPLTEFPNDKYKKSGKKSRCKGCEAEAARNKRRENPEASRAASARYRKNNLDKERERYTRYNKKNPHIRADLAAYRRAKQKDATPKWLSEKDRESIKQLYLSRKTLSDKFGVEFQVDHIVPLCGENICGLHVPWNLQLLEKTLNKAKSNSYVPEAIVQNRGDQNPWRSWNKCTKWDDPSG